MQINKRRPASLGIQTPLPHPSHACAPPRAPPPAPLSISPPPDFPYCVLHRLFQVVLRMRAFFYLLIYLLTHSCIDLLTHSLTYLLWLYEPGHTGHLLCLTYLINMLIDSVNIRSCTWWLGSRACLGVDLVCHAGLDPPGYYYGMQSSQYILVVSCVPAQMMILWKCGCLRF